jgi:hypothetical protein
MPEQLNAPALAYIKPCGFFLLQQETAPLSDLICFQSYPMALSFATNPADI